MFIRSIQLLVLPCLLLGLCDNSWGQSSIARPAPTSIRQVSASLDRSTVAARREATESPQIRVTVRYLMVDEDSRAAIYGTLDPESIFNVAQIPDLADANGDQPDPEGQNRLAFREIPSSDCRQHFNSPGRVTTCVLDESQLTAIIQLAASQPTNDVSNSPSIVLIDGKEAEMNDLVQHPMVVDVHMDGELIAPAVRVYDDGIRLRMLASRFGGKERVSNPSDLITLSCEVKSSRILNIKTHQIFGLQEKPVTVQSPIHQTSVVTASEALAKGETLMIDPHFARTKTVTQETSVPMIGRIPYVGRSFRNQSMGEIEQSMIVLLQPSVEPQQRPSSRTR